MPQVVLYFREGRSLDQKRALVKGMTDLLVEVLGVKPERVSVQLIEQKAENYGVAGVLRVDEK